jgi:hypothetical protein
MRFQQRHLMEPTYGDYDIDEVDGIDHLRERMKAAESVRDWSLILADHLSKGNNKLHEDVLVFNMNSATDCPNAKTKENGESETGLCQVGWQQCYAHVSENMYDESLNYRRRQEYLWDHLDPDTFAKAFRLAVDRKIAHYKCDNEERSAYDLRFSQSGDFRHRGDIIKADRVAELLQEDGIDVYTYSASYKLDWDVADHLVINESVEFADYGERNFTAFASLEDVPDDYVVCPHSYDKAMGVDADELTECGDCRLCIEEDAGDVAILAH